MLVPVVLQNALMKEHVFHNWCKLLEGGLHRGWIGDFYKGY